MGADQREFTGTDRFQVLSRLGAGGMGVVYEVLDRERNRRVALKLLRTQGPEPLLHFKNEFRSLQNIRHPNLVELDELFEEDGRWFFTMELVTGRNFLRYVRHGAVNASHDHSVDEWTPGGSSITEFDTRRLTGSARRLWGHLPAATGGFDEERLRDAARQLAIGVQAVHDAGKIHRDIKPSNILVDYDGRVVLLDFGFVRDAVEEHVSSGRVVGTADYMAPEQAASTKIGPEADWYSLGVVLYRALTGRLPFTGSRLEVLLKKQRLQPLPPRAISPDIPEDLNDLVVELLKLDPTDRPAGDTLLRRLGGAQEPARVSVSHQVGPVFLGREAELAALRGALDRASTEGAHVVAVTGESGIGKSSLVHEFARRVTAERGGALVLLGRCYERESVRFKAIDGVVDSLSHHLRQLSPTTARGLLPDDAVQLAQVFPVLRRVEAVARAPRGDRDVLDPAEQRARMFLALRHLLGRVAERGPLVVIVEDLQWADADSFAALDAVLAPPEAPRLLLITTARPSLVPSMVFATASADRVKRIALQRLSDSDARELAARLLGDAAPPSLVDTIASEAAGHPLFIDQLAHHSLAEGTDSSSRLPRLDEALWARIERQDPAARIVLEVTAVAGAPLAQQVAALAADLDFGAMAGHLAKLRAANLVRTEGTGRDDAIEPYHSRVREAVLARLAPDAMADRHERLALSFEAVDSSDPESLAIHWEGAGDLERAANYAAESAEHAAAALAFERAAERYRDSLRLWPRAGVYSRRLKTRLADVLAKLGRAKEAAEAYLDAALESSPAAMLELKRRAADQLLHSGHLEDGIAVIGSVLAESGMTLPESRQRAQTSLLARRARLRLRGLRFKERDASQIPLEDLTIIDICWSVAGALVFVDPIRGADFHTRHLLLALHAGEPVRVSRALAAEAAYLAHDGTRAERRTAKLLEDAQALVDEVDDPQPRGLVAMMRGTSWVRAGRFRDGVDQCDAAERVFRDECVGAYWERDTAQAASVVGLALMGDIRELTRRVPPQLREAERRNNRYAETNMRSGLANLVWLVSGDVDAARAQADAAMRQWAQDHVYVQHYYDVIARGHIDLYCGDAAQAYQRIVDRWDALDRAMLLRGQLPRILCHHLRGRAALAAGGTDDSLIAVARSEASAIEREGVLWGKALAGLLQAGVAARTGDDGHTQQLLAKAASGFDEAGMALHAAVARRRWAEVVGGDEGVELQAASDAWMEAQGVAEPARVAADLAPGFRD